MSTATASTVHRIHNFSAGPAVLPLAVLEEAQRDLISLPGVGMSVLEISHRSKVFDEIIQGAEADFRALARIPDGYQVLFLQGGASLQFSMVPMNLLPTGGTADYIVTGVWSKKAVKEAKKVGTRQRRRDHRGGEFRPHPAPGRAQADARRGLRPLHVEQHDLWHGVEDGARGGRRAAGLRRLVGHLRAADRRRPVRV